MSSYDAEERLQAWAEILDDSTYYELLGILDLADDETIRRAFHDFSGAFHPDVHTGSSAEARALSRRVFERGAEAYRVLLDPDLRAQYDLALAQGRVRLGKEQPVRNVAAMARTLEDICRSPSARLSARNADGLIGKGDLAGARRLLQQALGQDGYDNPELEERIEALDLAVFAKGG